MKLRVVLGTMTYGSQTQLEGATAQLAHFVGKCHAEVDTARMYNKGATESMLGAILGERADLRGALRVASKTKRVRRLRQGAHGRERRAPVRGDRGGAQGDARRRLLPP